MNKIDNFKYGLKSLKSSTNPKIKAIKEIINIS